MSVFANTRYVALLAIIGLGIITAIVAYGGHHNVHEAIAYAGFKIATIIPLRLVPLLFCALAWRNLIVDRTRLSFIRMVYFSWLRAGIDNLMPLLHIGGEIAALRFMAKFGVDEIKAGASMIVEVTLSIASLLILSLVTLALFAWEGESNGIIVHLIVGVIVATIVIIVFWILQSKGIMSVLSKIANLSFYRHTWKRAAGNLKELDHTVKFLYHRRRNLITSALFEIAAWLSGSIEVWLALYILGHPVPIWQAIFVEIITQLSVNMFFMMPAALGIQESSVLLSAYLLGIPVDYAVALALIRRCVDFLVYLPGVIVWQFQESKWFLRL